MTNFILFVILFFSVRIFAQNSLVETRTALIVKAFNAQAKDLLRPLTAKDIRLGARDGRADVNDEAKLSYYIHIDRSLDPLSPITLIPMATSRFTPTYYQSDAWWDANKAAIDAARREGRPAPRQDPEEVVKWLKEMKLTTNPDVIQINAKTQKFTRIPLQDFLLEHYLKYYSKDGFVTLFRGAEKAGESADWNRGVTPRGVRYWTPTANYAWRYARKNSQFLDEMMSGATPLFKFQVPTSVFKQMVTARWQKLTLGTELTKRVHDIFDQSGQFQDQLSNRQSYMGEGRYGVEFEIRSNRSGAQSMTSYYKGTATMDDLVSDRIEVLNLTKERLQMQNPEVSDSIERSFKSRIQSVQAEGMLIAALKENFADEVVLQALKGVQNPEITNIDGVNLSSWTQQQLARRHRGQLKTTEQQAQWKELAKRYETLGFKANKCLALF